MTTNRVVESALRNDLLDSNRDCRSLLRIRPNAYGIDELVIILPLNIDIGRQATEITTPYRLSDSQSWRVRDGWFDQIRNPLLRLTTRIV